jgi:hypothetical protein
MKRSILTNGIQFFLKPNDEGGGGGNSEHLHEQSHEGEQENKEVHVDKSEGFAKFREQFSAKKNAPDKVGEKPTPEQVDDARKQTERLAAERESQRKQAEATGKKIEENKRAGSNVPKILEDKRATEKERDEYKSKVEKYETEEKPAIEKKIAELEAKIAKGVSEEKEAEYNNKITDLETKMKEREDSLVNENQGLRQRLAFYNLQEDPDFIEKYVSPVKKAYSDAFEVLTTDRQRSAFRQALAINGQVLRAQTLMSERDEALDAVASDLKGFPSQRFTAAVTQYLNASVDHAKAMQNHEATTTEIRQQAQLRADKARAERLDSWDRTYKVTKQQYEKDEKLSAEEQKLAKELGIDVESELKKDDLLASKTVLGKSSMTDAIDIIHRGRVYNVQKARIQILEKQLADREAVITKLRGSGTEGGSKATEGNGSGQKKETTKPTREEWQRKFSVPQ